MLLRHLRHLSADHASGTLSRPRRAQAVLDAEENPAARTAKPEDVADFRFAERLRQSSFRTICRVADGPAAAAPAHRSITAPTAPATPVGARRYNLSSEPARRRAGRAHGGNGDGPDTGAHLILGQVDPGGAASAIT